MRLPDAATKQPREALDMDTARRIGCLLLMATLSARPSGAAAETRYEVHVGHWVIRSHADNCSASNRPELETQRAAINALFLYAMPDGTYALSIAFWPGALSAADTRMTLDAKIQGRFELEATPQAEDPDWTILRGAPLPEALVTTLGTFSNPPLLALHVSADASGSTTVFDIRDMPTVMYELGNCVRFIAPSP